MNDELLYRRYLTLSMVLTEIEEGRLVWNDFWLRFAEFCELVGEFSHRRYAASALKDLRKVERAAEAKQAGLALQHLITAVAQLRWRYGQ